MKQQPWLARHGYSLLLALLVVATVPLGVRAYTRATRTDFVVLYSAAAAYLSGGSVYPHEPPAVLDAVYTCGPAFVALMVPFALLPIQWASVAWFALNVGLVWACLLFCLNLAGVRERRFPVAVLALLCSSKFIDSNLRWGQSNLVVFCLCLLGFTLLRRRRPCWGGMALALAAGLKLTPVVFLFVLAWQRRWREAAAMVAGLLLFVVGLPALMWGPHRVAGVLAEWHGVVSLVPLPGLPRWNAHGLGSVAARLLTRANVENAPPKFVNLVDLPLPVVTAGWLLLLAAVAVLFAWALSGTGRDRQPGVSASQLSLLFVGLGLFSPYVEKHHLVILLLPYVVLVDRAFAGDRVSKWGAILSFALPMLLSKGIVPRPLFDALRMDYWVLSASMILLFLAVVRLAARERRKVVVAGEERAQA